MFPLPVFSGIASIKTPKLSDSRRGELVLFQKEIGLRFRRIELLDLAFCHRSFVNEFTEDIESNERLEFLGDAVLGLVITEHLFKSLPDRPEGDLARMKSHLVSEASLSEAAMRIGINRVVRVGRGEDVSGGRTRRSILADSMEALFGALYMDSGYNKVSRFILDAFGKSIESVRTDMHQKDYKTLLQELSQKEYQVFPKYILDSEEGPDHARIYRIKVSVDGKEYGPGKGSSKKNAEQDAANIALDALFKNFS